VSVGGAPITVTVPNGGKAGGWNRQTLRTERMRDAAPISFEPADGLELMNVFVKELK
jgi:hypothetical protein